MRATVLLICLLCVTGCDEKSPVGPTVPLNERFTLSPGEVAVIDDADVRLQFVRVTGDSRCPADAICIQGGDALVQVRAADGDDATLLGLHTGDASQASAVYRGAAHHARRAYSRIHSAAERSRRRTIARRSRSLSKDVRRTDGGRDGAAARSRERRTGGWAGVDVHGRRALRRPRADDDSRHPRGRSIVSANPSNGSSMQVYSSKWRGVSRVRQQQRTWMIVDPQVSRLHRNRTRRVGQRVRLARCVPATSRT